MSYTFRKVNMSIFFVTMGITGYCRNYVPTVVTTSPLSVRKSSNHVPSKVEAPTLCAGSAESENEHGFAIIRGFPQTLHAKVGLVR
jgi:hypothetical protein